MNTRRIKKELTKTINNTEIKIERKNDGKKETKKAARSTFFTSSKTAGSALSPLAEVLCHR